MGVCRPSSTGPTDVSAPAPERSLVQTRPVHSGDDALQRRLFAESRDDLALLPVEVRGPLLDMQYAARRDQYAAAHPGADQVVLQCDGIDVGSMTVDRTEQEVRLVDVSVALPHRRRGIARAALQALLDEAAAQSRPVHLQVWSDHHVARGLYARLGFTATTTDAGYLTMIAEATTPGRA